MHCAQSFELQLRALGGVYGRGADDPATGEWVEEFFHRPARKVANRLRLEPAMTERVVQAVENRNDLAHSYLLMVEMRLDAAEDESLLAAELHYLRTSAEEVVSLANELGRHYEDKERYRPRH